MSTSKLFRDEVLRAQSTQYLGTIRIGRNPAFTLVAIVALVLAGALVAFAVWGQVTRKARIAGVLMPTLGSVPLAAGTPGVLLERRVSEGERVAAGQVLFVLGTDRATAAGETAALVSGSLAQRKATLETERSLRELQARQRQQALSDRARGLEAEQRQADQEAELNRRRVGLAERNAERYAQLANDGFVADIQRQQRQEELLDLQGRAQAAQRNALALAREIQSLRAEIAAISTQRDTELAQIDRSLAALAQESTENEARKQLVVTAPQAGAVTGLTLSAGAPVQAGQTLGTLLPAGGCSPDGETVSVLADVVEAPPAATRSTVRAEVSKPSPASPNRCAAPPTDLEAQLYAPSRTAGFVRPGQSVWLRYAAYPYQKFGMAQGTVREVSRTPIAPQDLPAGQQQALLQAAQANEPLYRISVTLAQQAITTYGHPQPLKPGMTLDADVLQERRAVWEWLLEPVLAARQQMKVLSATPNSSGPGG